MTVYGARQGRRDGMSLREAGAARVKCQSEEGAGKHFLEALRKQDRSSLNTTQCYAVQYNDCKQVPHYNT